MTDSDVVQFLIDVNAEDYDFSEDENYVLKLAIGEENYILIDFLLFKHNKNERQKLIKKYNIKNLISKQWEKFNRVSELINDGV